MNFNFFSHFFAKKETNIPADAPRFVQEYLYLFEKEKKNYLRQDVNECRFVVFDTETTGFDYQKDKILSIGALELFNNQIDVEKSFELFIQRDDIVGNEAIDVHGILKKGKKTKIGQEEACQKFLEFCGDAILVGHHVGFDLAMMNRFLQTNYNIKLKNRSIDTGHLAQRIDYLENPYILRQGEDLSLDSLANRYRIETTDRHRALGDAYITAILFLKLMKKMKKSGRLSIGDVLREKAFGF